MSSVFCFDGVFDGSFFPLEAACTHVDGREVTKRFLHRVHQPFMSAKPLRFAINHLGVVNPHKFRTDCINENTLVEEIKNNARGVVYTYGYIAFNFLTDILPNFLIVDLAGRVEAKTLVGQSSCPYKHNKRYCSADKCVLLSNYVVNLY